MLLGWPLWVSLVVAAADRAHYTYPLGGLSAAIYNEVLQFFVIVAALPPLTLVGLHKIGGWDGLKEEVAASPGGGEQLSWPGTALSGFDNPLLSVIGIVFGLGFVLSFGYWTTNFVEVQRAMASNSMSAAQRSPIIGAFPKMFVPFIVIIPGMIAAVTVKSSSSSRRRPAGRRRTTTSILYLMRDLLPNGMLGVAIAGLLASFMAGMAANISAFNTVFSYDLWQTYVVKDKEDSYYTVVGRVATVAATVIAIGTATFAASYSNIMDLPADAVRVLQRPAVRDLHPRHVLEADDRGRRLVGLVAGTAAAVAVWVLSEDVLGVIGIGEQGAASSRPARRSSSTSSSPSWSASPTSPSRSAAGGPGLLAHRRTTRHDEVSRPAVVPAADPARRGRPGHGRPAQHPVLVGAAILTRWAPRPAHRTAKGGCVRHPHLHRLLIGMYGVVLVDGLFGTSEEDWPRPTASTSTCGPVSAWWSSRPCSGSGAGALRWSYRTRQSGSSAKRPLSRKVPTNGQSKFYGANG